MVSNEYLEGKTVLVTGGAGFIGSHIVDNLILHGCNVRVLDNFITGQYHNLEKVNKQIDIIYGDIRSFDTCKEAMEGCQFVIHQAALASVPSSLSDPVSTISVNVSGTANIFTAARDIGIKRVVYASSCAVYGNSRQLPLRENGKLNPLSPYALSKLMNEQLATLFSEAFNMSFVGLRYFNVFGPRQSLNGPYAAVIPQYCLACLKNTPPIIYGDGKQTRDFVFVTDVAHINVAALTSNIQNAIYNIGSGNAITINELANVIARISGYSGKFCYKPARSGEVKYSLSDIGLLNSSMLSFGNTNIAKALKEVVEYYRQTIDI